MYMTFNRISKIVNDLQSQIYPESFNIDSFKMKKGEFGGAENPELDDSLWQDFSGYDNWGGEIDAHYWFRTKVRIPEKFQGKTVVFRLETGREGQWDATNPQFILYINGELIQGLDVNHTETELAASAVAGDEYSIALHAYSGMLTGSIGLRGRVLVLDKEIEKLYYNIKVPLDVAALLDEEDIRRIDILKYLNDAVNMLDLRKPHSDSYYDSVRKANDYLEDEFYNNYCGNDEVIALCVGHTHIDVAWLWTLAQTREKAIRSFSTVTNLMESYPEYVFMSSQPQLYQFVKQDNPGLYEKIRNRIKEGKWEPEGGMWLEADCNLISGESIVRQLLFGTRFFEREFGVKNRILWLPDVFGYSAALPQILKKSGIDYFATTKISWNEYNKMPYDTFTWKGIDGTGILTHFITTRDYTGNHMHPHTTTYNGNLIPADVYGAWKRYQQKDLNREVIISYGYGDGGGGPTKEMLENARRLVKGIPGCPRVKLGKALEFFERLEKTTEGNKKLPQWVGELYLEYHRGTYTSMARNKKYNRKSEFLLQDVEWISVLNSVTGSNEQYPGDKINKCWETVLLNQFHDILPGSSIKEVYEDSKKQYEEILETGGEMLQKALKETAAKVNLDSSSVVVFNQLGFDRSDVAIASLPEEYKNGKLMDTDGNPVVLQQTDEGNAIFYAENIPAKGYKAYRLEKAGGQGMQNSASGNTEKLLKNNFFDIRFDDNYHIISILDKRNGRELIPEGCRANVLQAFEDKPLRFDAWDINLYYQEKMWEVDNVVKAELIEDGLVRTALRIERAFLDSTIVQTIYIYNDIPGIDFHNIIDWKEKQVLLKAAFPVDVHIDKATYEIQYGNVERPTHWNTSWDYARFEVCGHKWVDLSEDDYGVSLMNDCKYGYDIKDGVMRLTLLKSGIYPNEDADKEMHEFTYSLYPHPGNWKAGGTVQRAYGLNCPVYAVVEGPHAGSLPRSFSFVKTDRENVIIEVVKKAEDSDDIIIRLYECYNRRTTATIELFKEIYEVWECDLMENKQQKLVPSGKSFSFEIKPYEIKTFSVKLK